MEGVNLNERKKMKSLSANICIAVFAICILSANICFGQENKNEAKKDSVVTVKELYDEFKKDEAAATEKYAGKKVTIKGIAVKVGPDKYTYPGVELSEKKNGTTRALCVLPYTDYLKLRKVSKGDQVTMRGEVRQFLGKMDMIIIKQCEILSE